MSGSVKPSPFLKKKIPTVPLTKPVSPKLKTQQRAVRSTIPPKLILPHTLPPEPLLPKPIPNNDLVNQILRRNTPKPRRLKIVRPVGAPAVTSLPTKPRRKQVAVAGRTPAEVEALRQQGYGLLALSGLRQVGKGFLARTLDGRFFIRYS